MCRCLIVLALAVAADPSKADEKKSAFKLNNDEQAVLDLTNAERKKQNLQPLKANELLTKSAREHSANMAKQKKMDHVLDDKKPHERIEAIGYKFMAMAENVAMGQRTPAETIRSWMTSTSGHKENILNKDYTEFGIGIATDANGERYWTQVFAKPMGK